MHVSQHRRGRGWCEEKSTVMRQGAIEGVGGVGKVVCGGFPRAPGAETSPSSAEDAGSIPGQRTKSPHATQHPPPKEKKTKHKSNIVANSIKILKTVRTEDIFKRLQRVEWEWGE